MTIMAIALNYSPWSLESSRMTCLLDPFEARGTDRLGGKRKLLDLVAAVRVHSVE